MLGIINYCLYLILITFCIFAAIKDAKTRKIPNWIPLILFAFWIVSIVVKWILADIGILGSEIIDVFASCTMQVITSAVICCILAACVILVNKLRKNRGLAQHSAFGMGDVKLLMVVCLYLGFEGSFICILIACLCFIFFALIIRLCTSKKLDSAPFAPFILCGVIAYVLIDILL